MVAATRARLALSAAEPRLAVTARILGQQLDQLDALWRELAPFAELISGYPDTHAANLVEALEAILLTAIDAWDGDRESADTLCVLMSVDRREALERVVEAGRVQYRSTDSLVKAIVHFNAALGAIKILSDSLS